MAECDSTQPCAAGQACNRIRVCGEICDLLGQDCEPGFNCLPTGDNDGLNDGGMGARVAAGGQGYLDGCDPLRSDCQAGLSCEQTSPPPCDLAQQGGCCVPYCDPAASDPGCLDEAPTCDPLRDGPVGVCMD